MTREEQKGKQKSSLSGKHYTWLWKNPRVRRSLVPQELAEDDGHLPAQTPEPKSLPENSSVMLKSRDTGMQGDGPGEGILGK